MLLFSLDISQILAAHFAFSKSAPPEDIRRGGLCRLEDPLQQQKEHEAGESQDPHHQRVGKVHPQGDAGVGRGQPHQPQREKAQERVEEQLSHQLQGRAEDADQRQQQKGPDEQGQELHVHTASSFRSARAASAGALRSLMARIR